MYCYTDKIINKNVNCYVYFSCGDINKNINLLKNKFGIDLPDNLLEFLSSNKSKIFNFLANGNMFVIVKVDENRCSLETLEKMIERVSFLIKEERFIKVAQIILAPIPKFITFQVMKFIFYQYEFTKLKSKSRKSKNKQSKQCTIYFCGVKKAKDEIEMAIKQADIIREMRDMVNSPANIMDSTAFVESIKQLKKQRGVSMTLLNEAKLQKENLNLILSVNRGSNNKPYMLILEWKPKRGEKPIALVGKGVTFDAGGINVKHGAFHDMKTDMTGAAVVLSVFKLAVLNNLNKNIVAFIPLVENMVGDRATRPGDVITSHSGLTVEILNTDAEGRLIMADAISYSKKYKPTMIIDVATLTGQAGSIFNNMSIIMMGNSKKIQGDMEKAANKVNEKIWPLPLWKEYDKNLKSTVADVKNISLSARSGTIIGGTFLKHFVPTKTRWMHLDIAGVSYFENTKYMGATAISVMSLFEMLKITH